MVSVIGLLVVLEKGKGGDKSSDVWELKDRKRVEEKSEKFEKNLEVADDATCGSEEEGRQAERRVRAFYRHACIPYPIKN